MPEGVRALVSMIPAVADFMLQSRIMGKGAAWHPLVVMVTSILVALWRGRHGCGLTLGEPLSSADIGIQFAIPGKSRIRTRYRRNPLQRSSGGEKLTQQVVEGIMILNMQSMAAAREGSERGVWNVLCHIAAVFRVVVLASFAVRDQHRDINHGQ